MHHDNDRADTILGGEQPGPAAFTPQFPHRSSVVI